MGLFKEKETRTPFLFFDGAFGTFFRSERDDEAPCEEACLTDPEKVGAVHTAYLEAGARAILTNSFSVNPLAYPDGDKWKDLLRASFSIASKAASGFSALVFADLGPIASPVKEASAAYLSCVDCFLSLGAKHFLFETLDDFLPISPAVEKLLSPEIKDGYGVESVFVSFAVSEDGYTSSGRYYKDLLKEAADAGCGAVGLNCSCGPTHMRDLFQSLGRFPCRLLAMPNAGYPMKIGGRTEYHDNPDFFAARMLEIASLGVTCLGGCCGTRPEHIRKTVSLIREKGVDVFPPSAPPAGKTGKEGDGFLPLFGKKRVVAVEINPPSDADFTFVLETAKKLKAAGADVLTFTDSPLARPRADSVMTAVKVKREVGIDTMPHVSCRDKNRIALKGALLAAYAENVDKILAVTGDAVKDGGDGKGVFAFDSLRLISFVKSLNRDVFVSSPFFCGGALNVNARNFPGELARAESKEREGASFFLTQALFSDEAVENLALAHSRLSSPILAGIYPLAGYRNALFLKNEVAGIDVPDAVVEAMRGRSAEEEKAVSLSFAWETAQKAADFCAGYYISIPLKRVDLATGLIKMIGTLPPLKNGE